MRPARASFHPSLRRDAHEALIAGLAACLPPAARLLASRSTPWASATFIGARHELGYAIAAHDRPAAATLAAEIGRIEFVLPGHFVAEATGRLDDTTLSVEALTVEDG